MGVSGVTGIASLRILTHKKIHLINDLPVSNVLLTLSRGPIITVSFIKTKLHFPDIMQVICTVMVPPELIGNIAVSSSISCEGLLGSNGGNNGLLCRTLQRDRDQSEGQEGMDPDMFFIFHSLYQNTFTSPLFYGEHFFRIVVPYRDLPTEH